MAARGSGRRRSDKRPDAAIDVAVAVVERRGRVLVARRRADAHLPRVFEFPGGKIERGETPEAALRREVREEVGLEIESAEPVVLVEHAYPDRRVRLHFFRCRAPRGRARALAALEVLWVTVEDLLELEIPEPNRAVLRRHFLAPKAR